MTTEILVPVEWTQLSAEEKQLAQKWIESILEAKKNQALLIQLLFSKSNNKDTFLQTTQLSNEELDFEAKTDYNSASIDDKSRFVQLIKAIQSQNCDDCKKIGKTDGRCASCP